jgi:glucose-6-phosphate dehydrogenase assembly protein OpcA
MTLVVLAEESDDAGALGETIAALMPEHPARTIVIRLCGAGRRSLAARVFAQCWKPFGQRRQICCEQIEITASDAALADLPSVVLPLAAPDLPVMVWCRSARLAEMPEFREIAATARKVVLDSEGFADGRAALRSLAGGQRGGTLLADLAWTRLTRWREAVARAFEHRDAAGTSSVRVVSGGVAAWYMGAWIVDALADAGVRAELAVAAGEPARVELAGVRVARPEASPRGDYLAMREELGIVRSDPVFERALASAARLAYSTDR